MSRKRVMRMREADLQPAFRVYLEDRRRNTILDQTDALLMRRVSETNSLTDGARAAGISYRNAWDRVQRLERSLGRPVVSTRVGGRRGGEASLTETGESLLSAFRRMRKYLFDALDDQEFWEHVGYKLSARNRIRARIVTVEKGSVASGIKMRVLLPASLTSIISNEAVDELELREGDEVDAVIKATEVVIGKRTGRRGRD